MDDDPTGHLPARNLTAPQGRAAVSGRAQVVPAAGVRPSASKTGRQAAGFVFALFSLSIAFATLASSKPYLRLLGPAPLRFRQVPPANHQLLLALTPSVIAANTTNSTTQADPEKESPPSTEGADITVLGPLIVPERAQASNPFPGLTAVVESSFAVEEPVSTQSLLQFLCAPGAMPTHRTRLTSPLYFNPPQPLVLPSSTATYSTSKP